MTRTGCPLRRLLVLAPLLLLSCVPRTSSDPDLDRDGFPRSWELSQGTDPDRADTDGDGVNDGVEGLFFAGALDPELRPHHLFEDGYQLLYSAARGPDGGWDLAMWLFGFEVAATLARPNGSAPFGLALDQHGFPFVARGFELVRYEPFTGAIEKVVPLRDASGASIFVIDLAFDPHSLALYGIERIPADGLGPGRQLIRIDAASGRITRIGSALPWPVRGLSFAFDPSLADPEAARLLVAFDAGPERSELVETSLASLAAGSPDLQPIASIDAAVAGLSHDGAHWLASWELEAGVGALQDDGGGGSLFARPLGDTAGLPPCVAPCIVSKTWSEFEGLDFVFPFEFVDVDGDLDLDIVSTWHPPSGHTISLWRNDGPGQFAHATSLSTPFGLWTLADANGDGWVDVVVARPASLSILYGEGPFAFGLEISTPMLLADQFVHAIADADVTGDARVDLVVATDRGLLVLENDGVGRFSVQPPLVDGPGALDFVTLPGRGGEAHDVVAVCSGRLRMFRSDGTGGFADVLDRAFPADELPYGIAVGDLDADADPDVVLAIYGLESSRIEVYLDGARGSLHADRYELPASPSSPLRVVADVTADERADVAIGVQGGGVYGSAGIEVFAGDGSGFLARALRHPRLEGQEMSLAAADLDRDGFPDLLRLQGDTIEWLRVGTPFEPAPPLP